MAPIAATARTRVSRPWWVSRSSSQIRVFRLSSWVSSRASVTFMVLLLFLVVVGVGPGSHAPGRRSSAGIFAVCATWPAEENGLMFSLPCRRRPTPSPWPDATRPPAPYSRPARAAASRDSGLQNTNPSIIKSHCRRSVQLSPGLRTGENTISVSCSRLQYSCYRSSSFSRLFSSRRSDSS